MTARRRACPLPLVLLALVSAPAAAQLPAFLDAQPQVNQTIASDQRDPVVALAPGGGGYVVWESFSSPGNDASAAASRCSATAPAARSLGGQVQVNTSHRRRAEDPRRRLRPGLRPGRWSSGRARARPAPTASTCAPGSSRRNGTPVGADFAGQHSSPPTISSSRPSPARPSGFVVVWQSDDDTGAGADNNIVARVYDAAGVAADRRAAGQRDSSPERSPIPRSPPSGDDFLAVWQSGTSAGTRRHHHQHPGALDPRRLRRRAPSRSTTTRR